MTPPALALGIPGSATAWVACRVCGSPRSRLLCQLHNTHSPTTPLHPHRCQDCGTVFIGDPVGPDELGVAYGSLDSNSYYQDIAVENGHKMETAIKDLLAAGMREGKLIDVGTGNGMFVPMLARAGFHDVSVHEIEGNDLSHLAGQVKAAYQDYDFSTVPSDSFDVVTLMDVAEHVISPPYLMSTCHRILRSGGALYLHTPVVTRTDRFMHRLQRLPGLSALGRMWQSGRTNIFHLQNYDAGALEALLKRCGFTDVRIEVRNELSWPLKRYIQAFVLQRLGLPHALAPLLVPFLYPLMATNLFNANKAIVLARKP